MTNFETRQSTPTDDRRTPDDDRLRASYWTGMATGLGLGCFWALVGGIAAFFLLK